MAALSNEDKVLLLCDIWSVKSGHFATNLVSVRCFLEFVFSVIYCFLITDT